MTAAVVLSFGAGAVGVLGAWEALAAVERLRVAAVLGRAVEPLARAAREGRAPTGPERRRLALVSTGALVVAGWLVGGWPRVRSLRSAGRWWSPRSCVRGAGGTRVSCGPARVRQRGRSPTRSVPGTRSGARSWWPPEVSEVPPATSCGQPRAPSTSATRRSSRSRHCSGAPPTPAWDAIVAGILLQRDAGGDLAGLLRDQAAALAAAERIEHEARTATAQARFTARLVLVLPLGAAVLAELASPGLLAGLVTHPLSVWLVAMAAILQAAAILAVSRLAKARR